MRGCGELEHKGAGSPGEHVSTTSIARGTRVMEVFIHHTTTGHERVCIRFPSKPSQTIIATIKAAGGRYRRASEGNRACWYVPMQSLDTLVQSLGEDPLAAMLSAVHTQDAAPEQVPLPPPPAISPLAPPSTDEPDSYEEPGNARPHKRQRRSVRVQPSNDCFACGYEVNLAWYHPSWVSTKKGRGMGWYPPSWVPSLEETV